MRSVSVFTAKGGVGKTLVALQLAGSYSAIGARVLLVDCDPQMGAVTWSSLARQQQRTVPFAVSAAVSPGFDLVIYDHAPTMPNHLPGDVVVMPTLLDAASMLVATRSQKQVEQWGKPMVLVPNRVRSDRLEQRQILAHLAQTDPGFREIRDRAVYPAAFGRGATVFSADLRLAHAERARMEIDAVRDRVDELLNNTMGVAA